MDRPHRTLTVPDVLELVQADPERREILGIVASVAPTAWIGAGFVRNRLWDHAFGCSTPLTDVDVLLFSPMDAHYEARTADTLRNVAPHVDWDVRDQSRMHSYNGHQPYRSVADAVARFPETATAIAMRGDEVLAPYGLGDIGDRVVRPTPWGGPFLARLVSKRWTERWPGVRVEPDLPTTCADWLAYGGWTPIRRCPGRYLWTAGANPDFHRFATFVRWEARTPDTVFGAELPDGGFIAYEAPDHTVLTLGDRDGFARKRDALRGR